MWQCPGSPPSGPRGACPHLSTTLGSPCVRRCRLERRAAPLLWSPPPLISLRVSEGWLSQEVSQPDPWPLGSPKHTCVLGPLHHGGDLIAACCVALAESGLCAHANGLVVGLDSTQVGRGRACAVWHLSIHIVCLGTETPSDPLWDRCPDRDLALTPYLEPPPSRAFHSARP